MTKEKMRVAIADKLGWTEIYTGTIQCRLMGTDPLGLYTRMLPNYPEDLNACHEMEKVLWDKSLSSAYRDILTVDMGHGYNAIFCSATQRCEAFLKTLNLWTD